MHAIRPKSPPTWDPVAKKIYYIADLPGSGGTGMGEMGLRVVRVNATFVSGSWLVGGPLGWAVLWRGSSSDSSWYHSLVYTVRAPQAGGAAVLMAACTPPTFCLQNMSLVTFRGSFSLPSERGAANFSSAAASFTDMLVRWYWDGGSSSNGSATPPTTFVGQQVYVLSRDDRMWGMWTHCAPCPANSFSPAGSSSASSSSSSGISVCKCSDNFYGVLSRPVVDVCSACRIKFQPDGVTVSPESATTSCSNGQYKTNVPCKATSPDRTIDTTCAACYPSCRPGDASTAYPGEYISRTCDGSGFEPSVGCTTCSSVCSTDDVYMRTEVVCTGEHASICCCCCCCFSAAFEQNYA